MKTINNIHPKVAATGAAGAATVILVWMLGLFNVDMPAEVAAALTTLIGTAAGWFS